jgi:hypothetical protein
MIKARMARLSLFTIKDAILHEITCVNQPLFIIISYTWTIIITIHLFLHL